MHKFTAIIRRKKKETTQSVPSAGSYQHPLRTVKKHAGRIDEDTHHSLVFCSENGRGRRGWIGKREQRRDEPFAASAGDATAELRYHTIRVVPHRLQAEIYTEKSTP